MFNPIMKLISAGKRSTIMNIVLIGAGGNAGPLVQKLARSMYAYQESIQTGNQYWNDKYPRVNLLIADGDKVETKNLLRQPFIDMDVDHYKAEVLAERYSTAYEVPIYHFNNYINAKEDIDELFDTISSISASNLGSELNVLIGCVDNNATRQIMHEYFMEQKTLVYIDAGIEGVTGETDEEIFEAGFSGQVVCGVRYMNETLLEPVGVIFPDILEDKDSRTPLQACGMTIVNHPQRMHTNETAALVVHSYMNNLIFDGAITSHYINFNAQTMTSRPTYIKKEVLERKSQLEADRRNYRAILY